MYTYVYLLLLLLLLLLLPAGATVSRQLALYLLTHLINLTDYSFACTFCHKNNNTNNNSTSTSFRTIAKANVKMI